MRIKSYILIFLGILCAFSAFSQKSKAVLNKEISFHFGPAIFQGDVTSGLFFSKKKVSQLSFENCNLNIGSGMNFYISPSFSFKTNVNLLQLYGDDAWGKNEVRMLKFKTYLLDFSALIEYIYFNPLFEKKYLTLSTGVAFINFYPLGKYNGKWHNLRNASTEGQGLIKGTKKYKPIVLSMPINFGYFFDVNNRDKYGIEICFRKTFTDYIDDVSGRYYDNDEILKQKGESAAALADPKPIKSPSGTLRGNPRKNDNYTFINFSYRRLLGVKYVSKFL